MPPTRSPVLLQGFHWNSHTHDWWRVVRDHADAIADAGFTMVWLPPPSQSAAPQGYLPNEWYDLDSSAYGDQAGLKAAIAALHARGVHVLADIVINHRVGTADWADFSAPAFADNADAVTHDDEWGQGTGEADSGAGFHAARDLDHTEASVRTAITAWLRWLRDTIGFDGWRYDYVKGFHGRYVAEYNRATQPVFSVGEIWPDITGDYHASREGVDDHRQHIIDWIDATGGTSAAFDFTTKWQLMLAVERTEFWRLGSIPGTVGWWPETSVTFIDNHDTGPSPGGGQSHWPFPEDRVSLGYAYILTHPGTPTVYWPHYFDWDSDLRNEIDALIRVRHQQGITSTSGIDVQTAEAGRYAAIVNGNTAVTIGPEPWSPSKGGWTPAASGNEWAVWTR
ncbi:MAG: alpha-amylase C-terminal beta-sheet domain-containing protein [Bacteroidota bacterium]